MMLRSFIYLIFFTVGINTKSFSQIGRLSIGLERSPQFTWFSAKNADLIKTNNKWGDNYGLQIQYDFPGHLGISTNFIVANQKTDFQYAEQKFRLANRFFKIPFMLSYTAKPTGQASLIWRIGPQLSLLNRAEVSNNTSDISKASYDRRLLAGMTAYGGYRLYIVDFVSLNFGLRFDHDFSTLSYEDASAIHLPSGRNRTLSFVFGVNILNFLIN
ncbi:hypothetical protein GCM10023231_13510 [Olivibacter ginsenosidimutans]|uniref:Outer membrane protein beta-barrel domain-containing protein n=1 Tax=Olivibacter ginsenosidimutans TaxID=1176537 RepID=A0ABP9AYG5_9SPHI